MMKQYIIFVSVCTNELEADVDHEDDLPGFGIRV
jgi:hypothetical protein